MNCSSSKSNSRLKQGPTSCHTYVFMHETYIHNSEFSSITSINKLTPICDLELVAFHR